MIKYLSKLNFYIILLFSFMPLHLFAQEYVYWTEYTYGTNNSKIASIKTDGTDYSAITITNNTLPQGISIYSTKLFWNELLPSSARINQSFWTTPQIQQVIGNLSACRSIAVDNVNHKIYWTSSHVSQNKISRANIDGTGLEDLITFTSGYNIRQIGLDVTNNKMYWADFTLGTISKANLDGTNSSNIVTGGGGKGYTGVAIDPVNERIYWTEINQNQINSIKTDGTGFRSGITTGLDRPQYITYNNGKIYWTEAGNSTQFIKYASVDANGNISGVTILRSASNPGGIIVGPSPAALPVELISFVANIENVGTSSSILLQWQTATEVNNYGFDIERKQKNNSEWENLGFVQGSGNSNSPKQYSFSDKNPPLGDLQYRLKQIDTDGKFEYYSTIAEVNFNITDVSDKKLPKEFALMQNYPNPFNPSTKITFQIPQAGYVTLKVYDMLGNEIAVLIEGQKQPGYYNIDFNANNLSTGVYTYKLAAGSYTATKKLILIK